jgi:hypothetical protein
MIKSVGNSINNNHSIKIQNSHNGEYSYYDLLEELPQNLVQYSEEFKDPGSEPNSSNEVGL